MSNLLQWNKDNILKITIDDTKIEEDLIDFPLLINLSQTAGITGYDCSDFFTELEYPDFNGDTFEGITGDLPNTDLWFTSSVQNIIIESNTLKMSGTSSAYIESKFTLYNDFDIQVDALSDVSNPNINSYTNTLSITWRVGIYTNSVGIYKAYTSSSNKFVSFYTISGSSGVIANNTTSINPTKLRINKTTSTVYFYFWNGSSWTSMSTYTVDIANFKIKISSDRWDSYPNAINYFSNFLINTGTVVWPTETHPNAKKIALLYPSTQEHLTQEFVKESVLAIQSVNQANASANFTDTSQYKNTIIVKGGTQHSITQAIFSDSSIYFNGSNAYLSISTTTNLWFGANDFTIELWVNFYTLPDSGLWYCICSSNWDITSNNQLFFGLYNNAGAYVVKFLYSSNGSSASSIEKSISVVINTWYHIAVVRYNNYITVYVNGVGGTPVSFTASEFSYTAPLNIGVGNPNAGSPWYFNGYMQDIHITKGEAKYTENFEVPATFNTASYVNKTYNHTKQELLYCEIENFDQINKSVQLWVKVPKILYNQPTDILLYFDKNQNNNNTYIGVTGDFAAQKVWDDNYIAVYHMNQDISLSTNSILDSKNYSHCSTYGNMTNTQLVNGNLGKAIQFDGVDDYVATATNNNLITPTTNFTIETVIFPITDSPSVSRLVRFGGTQGWILSWKQDTNGIDFRIDGATGGSSVCKAINATSNINYVSNWHNISATYSSSTGSSIYINNELKGTATAVGSIQYNATTLSIGAGVGIEFNNSKISEVRISKNTRSNSWLKTAYYNDFDTLCTITKGNLYFVAGYVKEKDIPVQRTVYLYDRFSGELMDSCTSSINGYYLLKTTSSGVHNVVCLDDDSGLNYDDMIISKVTPTEVI